MFLSNKSYYTNILSIVLLALSIMLAGCQADEQTAILPNSDEIVIGLAHDFDLAAENSGYVKGIKLRVDEFNQLGGIGNKKAHLIIADDEGSVTTGAMVAQSFVDQGVTAVIGHWNSRVSLVAANIYERAQTVMVTPTSTSPQLTQKGYHYIFQQIPNDKATSSVMASYAAEHDLKRIVIYYADDDYGRGLANAFEDVGRSLGVHVVDRITDFGTGESFTRLVDRWQAFGFDAVFVAEAMPKGGAFVQQLRKASVDTPILGASGLDMPSYTKELGALADGTVVPTIFNFQIQNSQLTEFIKSFTQRYGREPDVWAVQGYETASMLIHALEESASSDDLTLADALHQIHSWQGLSGVLHFNEDGEIRGKPLYLKEVIEGIFTYIDTAIH